MYQVIARKYRPQIFQDVVNQEHVKTTLQNAILQGRVGHGYIFSGQRGTGKTTVARILARSLNCIEGPTATPCGVCPSCREITAGGTVDVIEIDAASNRGINEMRELRENVRFRPVRDRYKIFIIDEAHQITTEAFNALLKTIEEPPEWVVFVLCTTEAHKIPATIASRCQHFSFRSVDYEEITSRMAWICAQEGVEADAETLSVLAEAGEGSLRDSLSALDQAIACCGSKLNAGEVRALLGLFGLESLERVGAALEEGNARKMLEIIDELERSGQNLQHFSRELARYFRNLLVIRIAGASASARLIPLPAGQRQRLAETAARFSEEDLTRYLQLSLDLFRDLQASLQPRFHLEMGLVRMVRVGHLAPIEEALAEIRNAPASSATWSRSGTGAAPLIRSSRPGTVITDTPSELRPPEPDSAGKESARLHAHLSGKGLTHLADAVENSKLAVAGGELQILTSKSYKLYFEDSQFSAAVREIFGRPLRVRITVSEGAEPAPPRPSEGASQQEDETARRALVNPEVQRFREVFGGEIRSIRNLKE